MAELTLDLVARHPRPGFAFPGALAFSPDGSLLTFLHAEDGGLARTLYALDVATGERRVFFAPSVGVTDQNVSREEALRRERERMLHTGVTHYQWAEEAGVMLVPLRGELWLVEHGEARAVGSNAVDPRLSPDGTRIAFVREGELWVLDIATGNERRLTHNAEPGVTNGLAEYVAQEEMGRAHGFWWSRDGEWIAYEQADERHIPIFGIPHWGGDAAHDVEQHRYPFAGAENARIRLGVVRAFGGPTRWLDLDDVEYLARVAWHPDGRLFAQLQSRDQQRLELRAFDPATGDAVTILVEESDIWVNLGGNPSFIPATGEFVWESERSGFRQLYLYGGDGTLVRQITSGEFPVDAVIALDSAGRRVAYTASESPVEQHVWIASVDGGSPERLTDDGGMHGAVFSKDLSSWAEVRHARAQAPAVVLHHLARAVTIHPAPVVDLPLVTPELFSFESRDGVTLHGMVYKPASLPAPLIVSVYGGPHAQMVTDSWGARVDLRAQYLVSQGFCVMVVDNRGSARRGLAFEGAIKHRLGTIEIEDQVDGVRYAQAQGWVDGDRVGIYGWSYGGYMTIMCMLRAPDVFRVGVAGAPVTHWDGYDTHYTERYMGTPQSNPDGYRDGSAMEHAAQLKGKLLLIHGMIDENVHFRHTARFLDALSKANKHVDLLLYPSERHTPRSEKDRRAMEERIVEHFRAHLASSSRLNRLESTSCDSG